MEGTGGKTNPRVFISYSHDDDEHRETILGFCNSLIENGVKGIIDQHQFGGPPEGWPIWMESEIDQADFLLMIFTPTYKKRYEGKEEPGVGHGVRWEAHLIRQYMYSNLDNRRKIIPIILEGGLREWIPTALLDIDSYEMPNQFWNLYRILTHQPEVEAPELGRIVDLTSKKMPSMAIPPCPINDDSEATPEQIDQGEFDLNKCYESTCSELRSALLTNSSVFEEINSVFSEEFDIKNVDDLIGTFLKTDLNFILEKFRDWLDGRDDHKATGDIREILGLIMAAAVKDASWLAANRDSVKVGGYVGSVAELCHIEPLVAALFERPARWKIDDEDYPVGEGYLPCPSDLCPPGVDKESITNEHLSNIEQKLYGTFKDVKSMRLRGNKISGMTVSARLQRLIKDRKPLYSYFEDNHSLIEILSTHEHLKWLLLFKKDETVSLMDEQRDLAILVCDVIDRLDELEQSLG